MTEAEQEQQMRKEYERRTRKVIYPEREQYAEVCDE